MTRIHTHLFTYSLISFLLPVSVSFAAGTYDVSYSWGAKKQSAEVYATEVKKVLGPDIAKQIKVVQDGRKYGVIYDRNGDYETTRRVAANHAKLLHQAGVTKAKGSSAAYAMPSLDRSSIPSKRRSQPRRSRPRQSQPQPLTITSDSNLEESIDRYVKVLRKQGYACKHRSD